MSNQKFHQTTAFKKLNKDWYKKLKQSGFKDIEDHNCIDGRLIEATSTLVSGHLGMVNLEQISAKIEYYQLATRFLNDYVFENEIDKFVWSMHSEGISQRDIIKALKKSKKKMNWTKMSKIMKDLKSRMFKLYGITKD